MIKLIALDLDGTLLGPDFRVGEVDGAAVLAAKARGVQIVLNTARWYGIAQRTARRLEISTPLICHNGAHVKEPADDGAELLHMRIPTEPAREIAARCDEGGWETYTSVEGVTYMRSRWEGSIDPERLPADMRLAKTHAEHVTSPATGLIVFSEEGVRGVVDAFEERYRGTIDFHTAWSEATQPYVSITAAGADKGKALRLVLDHLGVPPEETMAIGDALPDVPMFELARVGIAMGNAPDDVKERADAVAPSHEDAGVAWAIQRYVLDGG
ncbi:MAG: Cof-type HAD-IIB family hydrolase [Dehalococcoidia bacterium]